MSETSDSDESSNVPFFTNEINSSEIKLQEVVGKGTFGVVRRGLWRGQEVAVKLIETEQEKKAFQIELRQLSRVSHPNIVRLYGASQDAGFVALVMEYAEGGSLYNVLHSEPLVPYTLSHAISWVLQCAKGVSYLHAMQPKALVHRDLKPPNLLLVSGGTILKICDFGTACDMHTHMTNNKGSAAWMAPEVFETSNYTEKCDVFSYGIILWEVLARKKPFDEIGGPAFRIMWAVHSGQRPPLLRKCPKVIENLMTKCWSKDPNERPPMKEVEQTVEQIFQFCSEHANDPIVNTLCNRNGEDSFSSTNYSQELHMQTQFGPQQIVTEPPVMNSATNAIDSNDLLLNANVSYSVPPMLSGLLSSSDLDSNSGRTTHKGHKRSNSSGTPVTISGSASNSLNKTRSINGLNEEQIMISNNSTNLIETAPPISRRPDLPRLSVPSISTFGNNTANNYIPRADPHMTDQTIPKDFNAYLVLESNLQPIQPDTNSPESIRIFEEHKLLSQEFLRMKMEVTLLTSRKQELQNCGTSMNSIQEYFNLKDENNALHRLKDNLKTQLDMIKSKVRQREATADGDWVLVDRTETQQNQN